MSDTLPPADAGSRLENIPTQHTLMRQALSPEGGSARAALVLHYRQAIRGYLGALLRDDGDADEVAHRVMLRLLQGAFNRQESYQGRFRDYLKRSVRNAALNFLREQDRQAGAAVDVGE